MKTVLKRVLSIVLCLSMLAGLIVVGDASDDRTYADTASTTLETRNNAYSGTYPSALKTNKLEDLGTAENPLVVLEVVPTLDQAQFGYFIPGCEPIDMDAVSKDYQTSRENMNLFHNFDLVNLTGHWLTPLFYEDIPSDSPYSVYRTESNAADYPERDGLTYTDSPQYVDGGKVVNCWYPDNSDDTCKEHGCFLNVGKNKGNFTRKYDYYAGINMSDVTAPDSNGQKYYFQYAGENKGDYNWVKQSDVPSNITVDDNSNPDQCIWMTRTGKFKCKVFAPYFYNKDTFIKKVFKDSSYGDDSFVSNVLTITPELLQSRLDLIDEADLIFFHTAQNTQVSRTVLWYQYNKDESVRSQSAGDLEDFDKHDLTNDMVIRIMRRMATDDPTALIFEAKGQVANNHELNIYKLMLMVTQFKPNDFVNTLGLLDVIEQKTKEQGTSKLYYPAQDSNMSYVWQPTTIRPKNEEGTRPAPTGTFAFDPNGNDITDYMRFDGGNFGLHNVFEKIMTYDGRNSMFQEFLEVGSVSNSTSDPLNGGNATSDLADYYKGKGPFSILEVMKFILSVSQYTPKLRVLEVEPCQQFIYQNDSYRMKDEDGNVKKDDNGKELGWKEYYEGLFPWYDSSQVGSGSWVEDESLLQVTTMTTAEFIGSTGRYEYGQQDEMSNPVLTIDSSDDLIAKYDMIVFGALQDKSNGKDGYNDTNLGNLIYTAVGDLVYTSSAEVSNVKMKNIQRDQIRYASNDITLKKMLELKDFLRAGKPIVVDSDLYDSDGNVDTKKVDKSSKLYDLLTWKDGTDKKANEKIFRYGSFTGKTMKKVIMKSSCQIIFYNDPNAYPTEYSYSEQDISYTVNGKTYTAKGAIASENYETKDAAGDAVMRFHFKIKGVAGRNYQVRLNIDSDGDGVYRGSLKEHSEIDNMNIALGKTGDDADVYDTNEVPLIMIVATDADFNNLVNPDQLQAEQSYYAKYTLPDDRLGIIPWKLEVCDADNNYLRSSAVDYTAFKTTQKPAELHVLQMCLPQNGNWKDDNLKNCWGKSMFHVFGTDCVDIGQKYYDPDYEYTEHSSDKLLNKLKEDSSWDGTLQTAEKFNQFLEPLRNTEFDVHIQFMFNSDWNTLFGNDAKDRDGNPVADGDRIDNWESFLSEYDMVILGFNDLNTFADNKVYQAGIMDYINQGKSMILSHDIVSAPSFPDEAGQQKYTYGTYTPWMRTVSGQRKAFYNKDEDTDTYVKSYMETLSNGSKVDAESSLTNTLKNDKYYHQFSAGTDFDSIEENLIGTYAKENIDNSAQLYGKYFISKPKPSNGDLKKDRVTVDGTDMSGVSWPESVAGTSLIKLTNNGQITSYPYQFDSVIQISNTHVQNYQLDMDYEEGGDVNVWYNLTDVFDPDVTSAGLGKGNSDGRTEIYSAKNQDSRNNFFIYNKGNITYTGSGHGGDNNGGSKSNVMTDDEVKLFINTMISAYRPPEAGPYVTIDNATSVASDGSSMLYVDYDAVRDADGNDSVDGDTLDSNVATVVTDEGTKERMVRVEFTVKNGSLSSLGSGGATSDESEGGEGDNSSSEESSNSENNVENSSGEVTEGNQTTNVSDNKTYYLSITRQDGTSVEASAIQSPEGAKHEQQTNGSKYMIVEANKKYVMYVPYSDVTHNGQLKYSFTTYAKYKKLFRKTERTMRTPKKTTDLTVMILPLFNLN